MARFVMRRFSGIPEADRATVRILDVGCGVGAQSSWLADAGFMVDGVDIAPSAIERANNRHQMTSAGSRLRFQVADACVLPFKDSSFDAVIDICTLQHVDDLQEGISSLARVLKPGGAVFSMFASADHHKLWGDTSGIVFRRLSQMEVYRYFPSPPFDTVMVDSHNHTDSGRLVSHWLIAAVKS